MTLMVVYRSAARPETFPSQHSGDAPDFLVLSPLVAPLQAELHALLTTGPTIPQAKIRAALDDRRGLVGDTPHLRGLRAVWSERERPRPAHRG